jgi:3',5'-cyclic AMP phosphodiesterase CpdA
VSIRIAHFTDLHVTEPPGDIAWKDLLSKRFIGWLNLKLGGRHDAMSDAVGIARAFVEDIREIDPDHVLFTGDVTGLSLPSEFERAHAILEPLVTAHNVTGIPGNHDVYVRSAVRRNLFDHWFGPWLQTDLRRRELPGPLQSSYPLPLVRYVGDEVAIVCLLDSRPTWWHDSSGHVDDVQLRAAEHILTHVVADRVRILALHYALRRPDGSPDTYLHRLRNAEDVLAMAARTKVDLVVHGHIHHRAIQPTTQPTGPTATVTIPTVTIPTVTMANPGPLAFRNCARAYHIYTVESGRIALSARRFDDASNRFVDWPDAPGAGPLA